MGDSSQLLIIGAGPFGLALAAYAARTGIDYRIVGRPMDFWRSNMPAGMYLRSDAEWHYDAAGEYTIERFLGEAGLTAADADPFPIDLYLQYAEWFRVSNGIQPLPEHVASLDRARDDDHIVATLEGGTELRAATVAVALGAGYFSHVPPELAAVLPPDRFVHTRDLVNFSGLTGKRVLVVGGRQSAFEWAALMQESGTEAIYLSYRHQTPSFEPAHWEWVADIVRSIEKDPAWYRRLTGEEKEALTARMFAEGRLKLEPWLVPRIPAHKVKQFPGTVVMKCQEQDGDRLEVTLSDGTRLDVHSVVLATGYKVDIARVPFLTRGNLFGQLAIRDGYPLLDERMESTVPGLFFTSSCAIQDFGLFFGFTVAVRTSAKLIAGVVRERGTESAARA